MRLQRLPSFRTLSADPALQVYLFGLVEFDAALSLQRQLVYETSGDRTSAALIICEHPPLITVGRHGSWAHILCGPEERRARRWRVRWVSRGGGCLLHLPGQLAIYPILPLDRLGLGLGAYLTSLRQVLLSLLADFSIRGETTAEQSGITVAGRPIAELGAAVRQWISYHGAVLNVNPDLEALAFVRSSAPRSGKVTSIARERHGALRLSLVRERLVEHFAAHFGFGRTSLFFDHPVLRPRVRRDALATSS
jgi:lipoyl(octanoyl) transferase